MVQRSRTSTGHAGSATEALKGNCSAGPQDAKPLSPSRRVTPHVVFVAQFEK